MVQPFVPFRKKPAPISISMTPAASRLLLSISRQVTRRRVEQITADVEVGTVYDGKVAKLMDFGAFVTILPGKDGLVHISQICEERVQNVSDKLSEGDIVKVKVLEVDKQGRIRLSMKAVAAEEKAEA